MKTLKLAFVAVAAVLITAAPALAQAEFYQKWSGATPQSELFSGAAIGAGLGAGLIILGAGFGFGRIGAAALEGMARQPEVRGNIQVAMIIIAALLEGA